MRYYFIYILIFLQSICLILKAESSDSLSLNYPYINYTTKDGLPSNETYCILQDSKGYIWIGTDRGLVKYDGYEFKTYTTLDGLNDNVILAINEDDDGNIWYTGLNTLELGYITPEMNFLSYRYNQEIIDTISNLLYSKLYFNDLYIKNENIYLVNRRFGFIKLSPKGIIDVYFKFNGISTFESNLYVKKDSNVQFVYANLVEYTFNSGYLNIFNSKEEGIFKYKKKQFREIFPTIINGNSEQCIYDGSDLITLKDSLVQHIQLPYLCSAFQLDSNTYIYIQLTE